MGRCKNCKKLGKTRSACPLRANNSQVKVGFLINKKWKDNTERVNNINPRETELVLRIRTHPTGETEFAKHRVTTVKSSF